MSQHSGTDALFGISLTSVNADAANALYGFFYVRALKAGFKCVYLGSPIPGLQKSKARKPELSAKDYIQLKHPLRKQEPYDPQLNYYYRKGFHEIISLQKDYFPHDKSENYGVIIRNRLPLSDLNWLWKRTPLVLLQLLQSLYLSMARNPKEV
jgi:hypothetical protein